jgi:5-methylcytosine-specific restriction endonuclease McrA
LCLGSFHRHKSSSDGRRSTCKSCRKAEYGTEEFKAKRRENRTQNAEQINTTKRAWYHAHLEQARLHAKNFRLRRPEQTKAYQQEYSRSERGKSRDKRYRTLHPEKVRAFSKAWIDEHPKEAQERHQVTSANYKAGQLGIPGKLTVYQWRELKNRHNSTCLRCKRQEPIITLTLDHVIPFALKGKNDITNVQPLCISCNISKGIKILDYRNVKEDQCG